MNKKKSQPCPACGSEMHLEKRPDAVSYLGHQRALDTMGWWCSKCPEAVLEGAALEARERAFLALKAQVDGVLGPEEVAAARERLGLSQRKAGEILGGGPRAFQKYEAGTQAVSVPMSRLLTLLANNPKRLRELPGAASSAKTGVTKRSRKSA